MLEIGFAIWNSLLVINEYGIVAARPRPRLRNELAFWCRGFANTHTHTLIHSLSVSSCTVVTKCDAATLQLCAHLLTTQFFPSIWLIFFFCQEYFPRLVGLELHFRSVFKRFESEGKMWINTETKQILSIHKDWLIGASRQMSLSNVNAFAPRSKFNFLIPISLGEKLKFESHWCRQAIAFFEKKKLYEKIAS